MIIIEEEGYSVMLTGVTQKEVDTFFNYLEKETPYSGVIGCSCFKVPKKEQKVEVFIIDCLNSKDGRREILDYWIKKGQKYEDDNVRMLNI